MEAVRRKRKADVRLWVGLWDEGIAGPGKRKNGGCTLGIGFLISLLSKLCMLQARSATCAKARLLASLSMDV